jgi:hypothetical protein
MMRISPFSSSGLVIAFSFFRECDWTFPEDSSKPSSATPLACILSADPSVPTIICTSRRHSRDPLPVSSNDR